MKGARPPEVPPGPAAAVRETHISWVFLLGDRVYKLKKPVTLDFLDLSSVLDRERLCRREVELNRRLAPDVYLGVAEIRDVAGEVCDHLVVMRRMPEDRRLSTLIEVGADATESVRQIARVVAAFHARAESSVAIAAAGAVESVRAHWEANFATLEPFLGSVLEADVAARVQHRALRYLDGRRSLFDRRIAAGAIRDGHGDLLADDIFCLPDGPRILDCLEFDDELRYGDVLADIGFLAMDLERIGAPQLARQLLDDYQEFAGETQPVSLVHHYVAYRAHVRAKVACIRSSQGDDTEAAVTSAQRLLALADQHLDAGRVRLVMVGGLPGTGKSTLAAGLSDRLGWTVLRSDEIRKDLAGVAHRDHRDDDFNEGLYGREVTAQTYAAMLDRTRSLLSLGESVVLDASWTDLRWRTAAQHVADATSSEFVQLRCAAPSDVTDARIARRFAHGRDVSDADSAVAVRMAAAADPWPLAITVDTATSRSDALESALGCL